MLVWGFFWLSVALIPFALWLHHPIPPFPWHHRGPVKTSRAWLFGLLVIVLRFLLQLPAVVRIGAGPAIVDVSPGAWMASALGAFVAMDVALGLLHHVWMDTATGLDRLRRKSVWILGPGYFLGLMLESFAVGWLLAGM